MVGQKMHVSGRDSSSEQLLRRSFEGHHSRLSSFRSFLFVFLFFATVRNIWRNVWTGEGLMQAFDIPFKAPVPTFCSFK